MTYDERGGAAPIAFWTPRGVRSAEVTDEEQENGLAGSLKLWLGVAVTAVALVAAVIGARNDWFSDKKQRQCHMSGRVTSTFGNAASGVRLGFDSGTGSFVQLTRTAPDGAFQSSCEAARRATSGMTFELLANGNFEGGPLPCLGSPEHTGVLVDREGESADLSVEIRGC